MASADSSFPQGFAAFAAKHNILGCKNWPAVHGVHFFNCAVLISTLSLGVYGISYIHLQRGTAWFGMMYFFFSIFGITAGYHRLWSHRSYRASYALQILLMLGGTSAVQGSCYWWARLHRSHHRYTDTSKDPYNSNRGLFWTHIGWMMFRSDTHAGPCDVSDLKSNALVQWQHRRYLPLALLFGFILPIAIPGLVWDDWFGGLCYACALRMTVSHHSVFCINSIAHYLGDKPYDDRHSPCDNLASAILTMGEGYHNFHHQFPMDYRNAFHWYQYDPTKWFIAACEIVGLSTQLQRFPQNEVHKSAFTMKLKALKQEQDALQWPSSADNLPIISWETFQERSAKRTLILVSGFIHDATDLLDFHPGGAKLLLTNTGKDMTAAFFGGVYEHSNAAHNLLAMRRVAILAGGVELVDGESYVPDSQRLLIRAQT